MRRVALLVIASLAATDQCVAAFEPEISAICAPKDIKPGSRGRIDLNKLMDELLGSRGIGFNDLRGTVTYDDKRAAITDPPMFCRSRSGVCGDEARQKLTLAYQDLNSFIQTHRTPLEAHRSGFEIGTNLPASAPITVREFLSATTSAICVVAPLLRGEEKTAESGKSSITQRVMVRKKIADLQVAQSSDGFKGLDRASLSVESDFLANTSTY